MSKRFYWRDALLILMWIVIVLAMTNAVFGANFETYQTHDRVLAKRIVDRACQLRQEMSLAWFGQELPEWDEHCRITWSGGDTQGVTTYRPGGDQPTMMEMHVSGSIDEIMQSSLPHEVMHLVLYDSFGFRLPRWVDEGVSSNVESASSHRKLQVKLIEHLNARRVPAMNEIFTAVDYPRDTLPFYTASVSVTRWLLNKQGSGALFAFVRVSRKADWTTGVKQIYGYDSIQAMQTDWLRWVSAGSPELQVSAKLSQYDQFGIPRSQAPYRPTPEAASKAEAPSLASEAFGTTKAAEPFDPTPKTKLVNIQCGNCRQPIQVIRLQGATGPAGPDGPQGPGPDDAQVDKSVTKYMNANPIKDGEDATQGMVDVSVGKYLDGKDLCCEVPEEKIKQVENNVFDRLKKYVDDNRYSPPAVGGVTHFVLVADPTASTWNYLKYAVDRASDTIEIKVATPPPEAGELPKLVPYSEGKPLGVISGYDAVYAELESIYLGTSSLLTER